MKHMRPAGMQGPHTCPSSAGLGGACNLNVHETTQKIAIGFEAAKIELVELDGRTVEQVQAVVGEAGTPTIRLSMPRLDDRTLRFSNLRARENYYGLQ